MTLLEFYTFELTAAYFI